MKKIFNILASISLVISGAGGVVAFGSTHITSSPTETDKLYNKLNQTSKPFLINQDSNFWGNETNYKKDLLADLEKVATIPTKDDVMLSLNADVKPLTQQGVQYIDVNIGSKNTEKIAVVKIDWELTKAQQPIYQFYTQTWPEVTAQYGSNIISLFYGGWDKTKKSPYWKTGDSLGWWQNGNAADSINHSIPWNDAFNTDVKNYLSTLIEGMQMPTSIKNMLHVIKPSTVDSLAINKSYNIPLDNIY